MTEWSHSTVYQDKDDSRYKLKTQVQLTQVRCISRKCPSILQRNSM